MKACLVGDDHVQGMWIGVGDLLEENSVYVLVDSGGEQQLVFMFTVHLKGFVQISPFISGGVRNMNAYSTPGPHSANNRQ